MVGGEVVIVEVLDPLYRGLQTSNARWGGLDGESFQETHRLGVSHGVIFPIEPQKHRFACHSSHYLFGMGMKRITMLGQRWMERKPKMALLASRCAS
jgi:hypothetical protein